MYLEGCEKAEQQTLITAFKDISENIRQILKQAQEDVEESVEDFASKKISKLFRIVGIYRKAFEQLNVKTKSEFERQAEHVFSDQTVREEFDELLQNEREWDIFLEEIDTALSSSHEDVFKEGDTFPLSQEEEIISAGGKILIVSFGEEIGAKNWLKETGCPYDMVLDSERKIYHSFGLYRSVLKVWNTACMVYYAEQLALGRQLPKPLANIHDDPQQMGGDFILTKDGVVKMAYCSQVSSDRPSVDHLLSKLKQEISIERKAHKSFL